MQKPKRILNADDLDEIVVDFLAGTIDETDARAKLNQVAEAERRLFLRRRYQLQTAGTFTRGQLTGSILKRLKAELWERIQKEAYEVKNNVI